MFLCHPHTHVRDMPIETRSSSSIGNGAVKRSFLSFSGCSSGGCTWKCIGCCSAAAVPKKRRSKRNQEEEENAVMAASLALAAAGADSAAGVAVIDSLLKGTATTAVVTQEEVRSSSCITSMEDVALSKEDADIFYGQDEQIDEEYISSFFEWELDALLIPDAERLWQEGMI